jgi:hypothetical protein
MARKASTTRVTERIARNSRSLPEFEEHDIIGDRDINPLTGCEYWRTETYTVPNWRNVRLFDYRYNCRDCGDQHQLPGPMRALICPDLPDEEARTRATGRVEGKIARACGQKPATSAAILSDIAWEIVWWSEDYPTWGRQIWTEYRHHPVLEGYIATAENPPIPEGDNYKLTAEEGELIYKHIPLVRKHAKRRASKVSDRGQPAVDDTIYDALEVVGMQAQEDAVRRFDPTRGTTFGAFAKKRVAGAMDNYLTRERIRTVGGTAYDVVLNGQDLADDAPPGGERKGVDRGTSKTPKRRRSSTGGYRETAYISSSVLPARRPDGVSNQRLISKGGVSSTVEAALAKLNPRQREVYRARVLTDPPVSRRSWGAGCGSMTTGKSAALKSRRTKRCACS